MDHPAFEIIEDGVARLLGGIAPEYFDNRPRVRIFTSTGTVSGVVTGYRRPEGGGRLLLDLEVDGSAGIGDWGIWEMEDWREDGDYLHLRASDDLEEYESLVRAIEEILAQRPVAARDFPSTDPAMTPGLNVACQASPSTTRQSLAWACCSW